MKIFAQLSFDHECHLQYREMAALDVLSQFKNCALWFQCVNFRAGKMLVEVFMDTDSLNAPRNEIEAESEIQKELDKAGLSASVLVLHGTDYIDETLPRKVGA